MSASVTELFAQSCGVTSYDPNRGEGTPGLVLQTIHRFHNRFSQSRRRLLLVVTSTYRGFLHSALNVEAVVASFNQEKVLVWAFFVIVQLRRLVVCSSNQDTRTRPFATFNCSFPIPALLLVNTVMNNRRPHRTLLYCSWFLLHAHCENNPVCFLGFPRLFQL